MRWREQQRLWRGLFARTTTPLRTAAGDVEARWIAGVLTESRYFDTRADETRSPAPS